MDAMKIKTTDEVVLRVISKIDERSMIGQEKYGDTMMSEVNSGKKDLARFMVDVQEELTDMLLYLEAARACLQDEIEECYINDRFEPVKGIEIYDEEVVEARMKNIGQNGNTGDHYDALSSMVVDDDNDTYWKSNSTSSNLLSDYP